MRKKREGDQNSKKMRTSFIDGACVVGFAAVLRFHRRGLLPAGMPHGFGVGRRKNYG